MSVETLLLMDPNDAKPFDDISLDEHLSFFDHYHAAFQVGSAYARRQEVFPDGARSSATENADGMSTASVAMAERLLDDVHGGARTSSSAARTFDGFDFSVPDEIVSSATADDDDESNRRECERDEQTCLGSDFTPGEWDVICGRGKSCFDHVGNRRFRILVANCLDRYVASENRMQKSDVVTTVVDQIRDASPQGGFVRKDSSNGTWYEVGTQAARDKVGHTIRDFLRQPYRNKRCRASDDCKMESKNSLLQIQDDIIKSTLRETQPTKKRKSVSTAALSSSEFDDEDKEDTDNDSAY